MIKVIVTPCCGDRGSDSWVEVAFGRVDAAKRTILARLFHSVTWPERHSTEGIRRRSTAKLQAPWPVSVSRTQRFPPTTPSCKPSYDAAVETATVGLGASSIRCGSETTSACGDTFTTCSPIDTSVVIGHFTLADGGRRRRRRRRGRRGVQPAWASTPWRERVRDPRSRRRPDLRALERRRRRAHGVGERQEPARGDRRGRGSGRPDPLLHARDASSTTGSTCRCSGSARPRSTSDVMRPYGVWAVIAPFNYPSALVGRSGGRGARRRQHVHHQAVRDRVAVRPPRSTDAFVDGGRAARRRQHRQRSGDQVGRRARRPHPASTGSRSPDRARVGMSIIQSFSTSHPKPAICEMGGKNPVIVAASADLDLAVEGTARSGVRVRRPEVLGGVAGVRRRVARRRVLRPPRGARRGDPDCVGRSTAAGSCRRSSTRRRSSATSRSSPTPASPARCCAAAPVSPTAHHGRGNFVAPTVVRVPDDSMIWTTELFVPLIAVRPVASLDEALERANAVPFGLTAGLFAERPGRDRPLPRPHRGRRRLRQPRRRRHHRRLARRAAVRRLEALAAPPARPAAARTTSSSTSASRAAPR